ncbi:MAG: hypothetical protein COW02_03530 [Comamonadaceae bacterium CG12_big_fil_rev_8_21_14_0_65_59_15]|nr:MAG: hypothetical protein COW02_03530 [Comamonadaceae bacterium CG12_big_fil_rev_8_21_14_0_65_59_15]
MENLDVMQFAVRYNGYLANQILLAAADLTEDAVCLDHGAGTGRFLQMVGSKFAKSYAIEIDPDYLKNLVGNGIDARSDLSTIPDNSVDIAWSFNVLEHIEDDQGTIEQLMAKLRPGGKLVIFVPAFNCLYSKMDELVGHVRRYTVNELYAKTMAAGGNVHSASYADSIGFFAAGVYRLVGGSGVLNENSIKFYDRFVFPASLALDNATFGSFGKSVLIHAVKK